VLTTAKHRLVPVRSTPTRLEGQGLIEYGLIVVLVSIAAMGALTLLGGGIEAVLGDIIAALP
jgi:Flp pilus assembly pilin Flp